MPVERISFFSSPLLPLCLKLLIIYEFISKIDTKIISRCINFHQSTVRLICVLCMEKAKKCVYVFLILLIVCVCVDYYRNALCCMHACTHTHVHTATSTTFKNVFGVPRGGICGYCLCRLLIVLSPTVSTSTLLVSGTVQTSVTGGRRRGRAFLFISMPAFMLRVLLSPLHLCACTPIHPKAL